MAKDRSEEPKKEKKSRLSLDGVSKPAKKEKKEKKEKKDKKEKKEKKEKKAQVESDEDVEMGDISEIVVNGDAEEVVRHMVPFADPLATEEEAKKILDGVKRASRNRALLTGIKETQKALRRSPTTNPAAPRGVVILAADTYPWDIISHMPVLCEDHHVPYVFVRSREALGKAGGSVRMQTSAMMVLAEKGTKKAAKAGEEAVPGELSPEEYKKGFEKLLKVANKAQERLKV